jgi:hypothetical protein
MKTISRHFRLMFVVMTVLVLATITGPNPVKAQSTVVLMAPAATTACVGTPITIKVSVQDVTNLVAYDLQVGFTPGSITVQSIQNSGWLGAPPAFGFFPLVSTIDNVAGNIHLAGTQFGTPYRTGDGDLINITLLATVPDQIVNFTVFPDSGNNMLSDNNGFRIPYTPANGIVYTRTCNPTSANQLSFSSLNDGLSAILNWETANESDNLGFNLYRSASNNGLKTRVNGSLIPTNVAPGSLLGATYSYTDTGSDLSAGLKPGQTYFYWLESVSISGKTEQYGPVTLTIPGNGVEGGSSSITASMGGTSFTGISTGKLYSSSDLARKQYKYTPSVNWRQHHRIHSGAYYEFLRSQGSSPDKAYSFWLYDGVRLLTRDFVFSSAITRAITK